MIDIVAEPDPPELDAEFARFHGRIAFDIGANVGQSARSLAPRFDRVYSCEPADESYRLLEEEAARFDNVVPLHVAIAAKPGQIVLTVQENHIARGQLTAYTDAVEDGHAWGKVTGHRTVLAETIDRLTQRYGQPDLIKCDVEGSEVEVFKGATHTLQAQPALYVEVHNAQLGEQLENQLRPIYGSRLRQVRHPHYSPDSWGHDNHWWWTTD